MRIQPAPPFRHAEKEVKVIKVPGPRFDGESIRSLGRFVAGSAVPQVNLDFDRVTFVTGGGLGQLVVLHSRLQAATSRLILSNVDARVYEVLEATRLTTLLDVRLK